MALACTSCSGAQQRGLQTSWHPESQGPREGTSVSSNLWGPWLPTSDLTDLPSNRPHPLKVSPPTRHQAFSPWLLRNTYQCLTRLLMEVTSVERRLHKVGTPRRPWGPSFQHACTQSLKWKGACPESQCSSTYFSQQCWHWGSLNHCA